MKNVLRSFFASAVLLIILLITPAAFAKTVDPTEGFYVNDYANVLSPANEQYIQSQSVQLQKQTKAQVVVVTIPALDGTPIEDYTYELFNKWGIGDQEKDNGILILLSVSEPRIRIEVGRGLEGAVNDAKAGRYLDEYYVPRKAEKDYNQALYDVYNAMLAEVYKEYNLPLPSDVPYIPVDSLTDTDTDIPSGIKTIGIIAVIIIFILVSSTRGGRGLIRMASYRGMGGGFGGGGFSGGGFSGGGGSSGGGGASR